ncbi:hypothetical protein PaG_02409 [Moesziomyces aphidis]|uniref:Dynactin subunit 4 n=1 Tax=Moesziomyces aphidis TaxID=84754 RepID=W3VME0_MOEAP|nr:hypothetical protein PaG_02409 [Moesziomyces aphidis]
MASPHVLYYCPCSPHNPNDASSSSAGGSRQTSSLASPPPGLPASSPASSHAFHPLESLYFCDECNHIRCNRCVTLDISSYYCPNCLFEVPGASVKAEKNRCARNCFVCPCCQHTLSVLASDAQNARDLDPTDPVASQGASPYYLGCSFCRWDSRPIGLVFDKPTGLSLQLQRSEENAPDVLEFDRLKDHFDPYLKTQTQAAIASAAVGSSSGSRSRSSQSTAATATATESTSSSDPARSSRTSRVTAARNAATAALSSSRLLRDLPQLANSRNPHALSSAARSAPIEPDELKTYRALNPWQAPADSRRSSSASSSSMGVVAKREKHRRDYLARIQSAPNQPITSLDDKIASLQQRWSSASIADQPIRAADLRPTRVPLKSKLSKRCPACRHIVIKPDIKAASNRFKIKLVALNFLPEIQLALAPQQPHLDPLRFRSSATSGQPFTPAGSLRRRPLSVLGAATASAPSDPLAPAASSITATSHDVDVNNLIPGHTYSFQINITNPLDDPIEAHFNFVRFAPPDRANKSSSTNAHRQSTVQTLPEPRYIFSSPHHPSKDQSTPQAEPKQTSAKPSRRPRLGWQVYPSAYSVPLNAFNEVWELEESDDLIASKSGTDTAQNANSAQINDATHRHYAVKTAIIRGSGTDPNDSSAWAIEDDEQDDDDDDGYDDTDDDDADTDNADSALSNIQEEQDSTASPPHNSAQTARRQRASLLPSARRRRRPRQASSAATNQRPPFIQKGHTTTLFLDLAISSNDAPAPGPIELGMHVTYRYTAAAAEPAEPPPTGKDSSFWTSLRLGTIVGASLL